MMEHKHYGHVGVNIISDLISAIESLFELLPTSPSRESVGPGFHPSWEQRPRHILSPRSPAAVGAFSILTPSEEVKKRS